jgi:hypothetical protein
LVVKSVPFRYKFLSFEAKRPGLIPKIYNNSGFGRQIIEMIQDCELLVLRYRKGVKLSRRNEQDCVEMENKRRTWGKLWTYFLITGVMLLVNGITWYLVEMRRDKDAAAFYMVSKANEEQLGSIQRYVEDMPDGIEKETLNELLTPIYIVRTRAEMDSIRKVRDSNPPLQGI